MMKKLIGLSAAIALIATSFIINSCSTEVELIAPYKSVPVIVGVLDHTVDTQFFRINRTFLGEGNANLFASIRDSVEYPDGTVEAWLIKYRTPTSGNVDNLASWTKLDSMPLLPIDLPSRSPGVFYNSNIRYYYTAQPLFTTQEINTIATMRYQLRATTPTGTYTAVTDFPTITSGNIGFPGATPIPVRLEFYSNQISNYLTLTFAYSLDPRSARMEGALRINYDVDLTGGGTLTDQFIDYNLFAENNQQGSAATRTISFNTENWYVFVGQKFRAIPNAQKIRINNVEFRLTGANRELATYIQVAQPISQFVPVLSTYTNLSGDAIGIFGSKRQVARVAYINEPGLGQLANGPHTSGPCYCVNWIEGTSYNCSVPPATCP